MIQFDTKEAEHEFFQQVLYKETLMKQQVVKTLKSLKVNIVTHMYMKYGKHCKDFDQVYMYLVSNGYNVSMHKRYITFDELPALTIAEKYDSKGKAYFGFM